MYAASNIRERDLHVLNSKAYLSLAYAAVSCEGISACVVHCGSASIWCTAYSVEQLFVSVTNTMCQSRYLPA